MFRGKKERKRRGLNTDKHKAMIITDRICQNRIKLFIIVNYKNECNMDFTNRLWFTFFDQPQ